MSLLTGSSVAGQASKLETLWKAARSGHYRTPGSIELQQATELFRQELADNPSSSLQQAWLSLGWQRTAIQLNGSICQVLHESVQRREGRGFYLFCPQIKRTSALQIPHAFKDLHTGRIALAMANAARFRVVAWNTVPRYREDEQGRHSADLAHLQESYFNALTRALATDTAIDQVIQLHGFSRGKRKGNGQDAHIILSNGTHKPDQVVLDLATQLHEVLQVDTRVFPYNIRELGALTNRQGNILREADQHNFIHIELSAELRKRLRNDSRARQAFADSLPGIRESAEKNARRDTP